ncbi:efflux RND transporter periplasmic adaptor subunit [Pseudobutyrivibrio sp.]|uniref:efflux RND transporter periplasmic adaptor subunit n=1 Tax=Pseudobutyrivibrio sp. TaxID=2014367 RepID=UPI001D3A4E9E|nr:efflux RND transporter periplasmic adaptor subunit [Pseudobutyrivibrio sp.]MBE5910827.1 HlyD family efflux transporter periplasmic adaptor subunit [Pseudobutyrivibrio sp.]
MKMKKVLERIKFWNRHAEEDQYLDDEIDDELNEEEGLSYKDKLSLKRLNKKVVAAMVIAVLTISTIIGVSTVRAFGTEETEMETITVPATSQTIQKTLSATGTIISAEESSQFATTTNSYPVEEIYVKVGDQVKAGDQLYKLDMSTMEDQLSYQQQALSIQNQQNAISTDNANRQLQEAWDNGAIKVNEANASLAEAQQAQTAANREKQNSNNTLNDKKNAESSAKTALDNANAAVETAKKALDDAKANSNDSLISELNSKVTELTNEKNNELAEDAAADVSDLNTQIESIKSEITSLQEAVTNAQKAYDDAVSTASEKQTAYDSAVAERKAAESGVQTANDAVAKANANVNSAASNVGNVQNSANQEIINQSQAVTNNQLTTQSNTLSTQQEIEKSKEELSKAIVYATQDGTVTNVNIVKGQTYSGLDAVVIDNVTSLKATADIDEAQIAQIAVGQRVEIKTDSTGDEVLYGTVSFVSPTATKNSTKTTDSSSTTASVSKTRATYRVDVTLDDISDALRLGMTAKMNFIIANADNALSVPTSDIQTDVDGNKYVVVQKADGKTENVTVTTGIADDFYTEITGGDLKDGDLIVESTADDGYEATLDSMGADGGIYVE